MTKNSVKGPCLYKRSRGWEEVTVFRERVNTVLERESLDGFDPSEKGP